MTTGNGNTPNNTKPRSDALRALLDALQVVVAEIDSDDASTANDSRQTPPPCIAPGVPEEVFVVDPRLLGCDLNVDVVLAIATRMRALLALLQADGEGGGLDHQRGFVNHHDTIMGALWLLDSLVSQLHALVMASSKVRAAA